MSFDTIIRLAFSNYHDHGALIRSSLSQEKAIQACLLEGDPQAKVPFAIKATLDWSLAQLQKKESEYARVSYDLLIKRYIETMSATAYADLYLISDATSQSRRKAAVDRVSKIIQREFETSTALDDRRQRMIASRYHACTPDQQLVLRFLSLGQKPIPLEIEAHIDTLPLEETIPELVGKNLLQMGDFSRTIQVHPQMIKQVREWVDAAESRIFHSQIAKFYEQRRIYETAILHWQQAGKMAHSATLLLEHHHPLSFDAIRDLILVFRIDDVPHDTWAQLRLLSGNAAMRTDDLESAVTDFRQAIIAHDPEIKAQAYFDLARVYTQLDPEKALLYCDTCQRIVEPLSTLTSQEIHAKVLIQQAWIDVEQNQNLERASINLERAANLLTNYADHTWSLIHYEWHIVQGNLHKSQDKLELAAEQCWQAWQLAQEANDIEKATNCTFNLGTIYTTIKDFGKGRHYYEESLQLASVNNNERMVAINQQGLGYCAFWQKMYGSAVEHYLSAYTYFKQNGDLYWHSAVCHDLAEALIHDGQENQALIYFQEGIQFLKDIENNNIETLFTMLLENFPELSPDLSPRQREIITYVRQNGAIARQQCSEITGLKARQAGTLLTELIKAGLLEKQGKGKTTRYILPTRPTSTPDSDNENGVDHQQKDTDKMTS